MNLIKQSIRQLCLVALLTVFVFSSTGCQLSLIKLPSLSRRAKQHCNTRYSQRANCHAHAHGTGDLHRSHS